MSTFAFRQNMLLVRLIQSLADIEKVFDNHIQLAHNNFLLSERNVNGTRIPGRDDARRCVGDGWEEAQ